MAQPQQYHGTGGEAPVWPGEGTTSYRDSYRPDPFPCGTADRVPGCDVDVELNTITRCTIAGGAVRQTLPRSITISPPQHTEYGRTAAN